MANKRSKLQAKSQLPGKSIEDAKKELSGFNNLLKGTDTLGDSPGNKFKNTEGSLVDLIDEDASPQSLETNRTYVAVGYDENYNLIFGDYDQMQMATKFAGSTRVASVPDAYKNLFDAYKYAAAKGDGVLLMKEVNDDVLSSDPSDEQITYLPTGNSAIMVSNTTNGIDQYATNFECDLAKNILITTSDGVDYCMPFEKCKGGRPDGRVSLLTVEQQYIAGITNTPSEDREASYLGQAETREDPVLQQKIKDGTIKEAEKMSNDDPRRLGGKNPKTGITESVFGSTTSSTKSTGKSAGRTGSRRRTGSRAESTSASATRTASGRGASYSSASGGKTGIQSSAVDSRKKESSAEDLLTFVPFTFTLGGG
jgi:hypothetical protein